jgi:hypothetical protein
MLTAPGKVALELVQGNVELDVLAAVEARHLHLGQLLQDPGPAHSSAQFSSLLPLSRGPPLGCRASGLPYNKLTLHCLRHATS